MPPRRRALPLGRRDGVVPHGPDIVGEVVGDHGMEEVVEAVRALLGVVAAALFDRRVSGRLIPAGYSVKVAAGSKLKEAAKGK